MMSTFMENMSKLIDDYFKLKKRPIIHKDFVNSLGRLCYLCNQACSISLIKCTDRWELVTCKNCLRKKPIKIDKAKVVGKARHIKE